MTNLTHLRRFLGCTMIVIAIGCTDQQSDSSRDSIQGAGSTFAAPLIEHWGEKYQQLHKDSIAYDSIGSGDGLKRFLGKMKPEVDFAATEAFPDEGELDNVPGGGRLIPITAGSIVIGYNRLIPDGIKLPRGIYADIFLGKIKHWDDSRIKEANPDLSIPHAPIVVVTRTDSSGTTFAFTQHLSAISDEWNNGPGAAKTIDWPVSGGDGRGNENQAGQIKHTPGAIGYVQYGIAQRAGLNMATLENKAGNFVEPTEESFLDALDNAEVPADLRLTIADPAGDEAYPIVTLCWAVIADDYSATKRSPKAKEFIRWCLEHGQDDVGDLGYAKLPKSLVDKSLASLAETK